MPTKTFTGTQQNDPFISGMGNARTPQEMAASNTTGTGAGSLDPTITSSSLTSTTPIIPVQPVQTQNVPGVDTSTYTTATTLGTGEQQASDLTKAIQDLNTQYAGRAAYQTQQYDLAGVNQIQSAINDNTTAIKQLQNEANAIPLQAQQNATGRGITAAGLAPIQTANLRNNAIKALGLSSISDALNNNLVAAKTKADQAVNAKYGPIEAEIAAKTKNLQLILNDPRTTLQEKNRANAQLEIQNAKAAQIAQQKTDQAAILKTAQDAAANAPNFKPISVDGAYYPTLSSALNGIANAKTPAEASNIAALTGLIPQGTQPASVQEYQFAVKNGYTGSFTQYQNEDANRKVAIAKAGVAVVPGTSITPEAQTKNLTTVNDVNSILSNPAFDSTFGVYNTLNRNYPGTDAYKLSSDVNNLISNLALAARGQLKGQGQISDFEGKMLRDAQTALKINMTPEQARQELIKVRGAIMTSSGLAAPVKITAPDGSVKYGDADQGTITGAISAGYKVEYQ